jgi:hypothetical protein
MAKFPPDRFDGVPDTPLRVGAHRSGARRHHGWIVFAWAALATGVLVGAGVVALAVTDNGFKFDDPGTSKAASTPTPTATSGSSKPTPTSTPTPTVTPLLDPTTIDPSVTKITVLNATTTAGLAASAGTTLMNGGWKIASEGNAASPATTSIVYYDSSATDNQSIALGIAQKLGIKIVQASSSFPDATITVVLGSDFVAP